MGGQPISGRVAAVTGGARGIGRAIAASLVRRGARVAVGDLDRDAAERAAAELGGDTVGLQVDVTDPSSFEAFLDAARDAHGPLELLVNNAGVMVVGPLVDANPAAAARVMNVNVDGVVNGMRLAVPRLRGRGGGQIVNVISGAGWVAPAALATYAASKHAARALSDSVREEVRADGIRVTAVYPMLVQTELAVGTKPARGGRWISPEEVGEAVAAAVEKPRDEVFVPRWVAGVLRIQAALPPRGRDAMARAFGVDKLYTSVDPKTRAEYERRLGDG
jgi:NAD(P)-dependent dehydrogenase (short-subunit alcohol dehydrogenase family)